MTRARRILLVEDHRDSVEFLTSLLQMAQSGHQIVNVRSAEEAILEVQQGAFELLLTARELPGMDGLELARQAQRYRPGIRTVVISGQAGRPRPEDLELAGVRHYFNKPLDTAAFLEAIAGLLAAGHGASGRGPAANRAATPGPDQLLTTERRLQRLRNDTGALQVLVADRSGRVLFALGSNDAGLDRAALAALLARGLAYSDGVSAMLQAEAPAGIHYYLGRQQDVYCANIDERHFLVVVVAAGQRRGVIGSLWVYGQKAAAELRGSLQELAGPPAAPPGALPPGPETIPVAAPPPEPQPVRAASSTPAEPVADSMAGPPVEEQDPAPTREQASVPAGAPKGDGDDDLAEYWEEAADSGSEEALFPRRFSLAEARKHGLIPPEFSPEADQ